MTKRPPIDVAPAPAGAPVVWKSLDALEAPELADARRTTEFPKGFDVNLENLLSRRGFLTLASATAAAVGLEGCIRRPAEKILPYARAPEWLVPGIPLHYATVMNDSGEALGLLVTTHEGRPTKIEGNAEHPTSRGATTLQVQASLLDLYDPDRSLTPLTRGAGGARKAATFAELDAFLTEKLRALEATGGRGLRILAAPTNSPSFVRLRGAVMQRLPNARFHTWASVSDANAREGARIAFGAPMQTIPDLERASVVVSLDCDFMQTEPGSVHASRGFAARRRLGTAPILAGRDADTAAARFAMSRLYVVEPTYSTTGANADNRLRLASRDVERFLRAVAAELVRQGLDLGETGAALGEVARDGIPEKWISEVARELGTAGREAAILVGSRQPPAVHALAHAIHAALGCIGRTVRHTPVLDRDQPGDLAADVMALATDIDADAVDTLLILGGNPAYDGPADAKLAERIRRVETSIHLSSRDDETSSLCTWHVPLAHELETWGDQRASDGTVAVQQPMIAPLRGGRSEIEMLAIVAGEPNWRGHPIVRKTLRGVATPTTAFERSWRQALRDGVVRGSTLRGSAQSAIDHGRVAEALRRPAPESRPLGPDNLELVFAACPKMRDGRHANNAWLQEMPDPLTRITWDNAALVSPRTAEALSLRTGDLVRITRESKSVEIAAFVLPGHADQCVTLWLGWGRRLAGRHGNGHGVDVHPLRTSGAMGFADGARVQKIGSSQIVQTQDHWDMEGRPVAIDATLEEYQNGPTFPSYRSVELRQRPLWTEVEYRGYKWGLSIDLNACNGCNACVIACQAENNIPVVGKDLVRRGREMHWLRIDRYFLNAPTRGAADRVEELEHPTDVHDPVVAFQPVACQQCEDAPCENVCPVNATAHSPEGLNDMSYNRCIGTRYCANNCPYKVRRFNYLAYHAPFDNVVEEKRMQFNPNVTVRMRGVMEKCTYCVQRIQAAKIESRNEGRFVRDGEIKTACEQSCPTQAIVFGDLNQPKSRVAKLAETDRRYMLLAEVGTHPRTFYLAKIRNPNRELLA